MRCPIALPKSEIDKELGNEGDFFYFLEMVGMGQKSTEEVMRATYKVFDLGSIFINKEARR